MYSLIKQSSPVFRLIAPISIVFLVLSCLLLLITLPSRGSSGPSLADPEPTPPFIAGLKPNPGYKGPFADRFCFELWDGPPLTKVNDSSDYIWANTIIFLDNAKIGPEFLDGFNWDMLENRDDGTGHMVAVGGPIEFCYRSSLRAGLHIATVYIKSMSGTIYSYTWAFNIKSVDPTLYAIAVTATNDSLAATNKAFEATQSAEYATCQAAKSCPTFDFSVYASAFASEVATSVSPTSP